MKLSIITINLNNLEGLQRTANSVITQTFRDFEWIVIDGGSTDGSREIIEQNANQIAFCVSEPDTGVYNAMNKGIKVAKGEYLLFLNSGDWLCNKDILKAIFQNNHSADILFGYMVRGNLDGDYCHKDMMKPVLYWYDFLGNSLPHQASFIAKRLFDKCGLYDETYKIAADTKFFIKAIVWEKSSYEFIPLTISVFEGGGISDSNLRFEERDIRLQNEMFPKMMLDDISLLTTIRRIKNITILRKIYTFLDVIANKISKKDV